MCELIMIKACSEISLKLKYFLAQELSQIYKKIKNKRAEDRARFFFD